MTTHFAVYESPDRNMPMLAVVIDNGQVLACEAVTSKAEGQSLLDRVRENLPDFIREASHPRA